MSKGKYATILLAAGLSSRMGRLKALLTWQGKPLIQYQIEQMQQAGIDDIIVVLGYQAKKLRKIVQPYNVPVVVNDAFYLGKSTSIRKGAANISSHTKGIFISAVDQPVPSNTLCLLKDHLETTDAPCVIPVYEGKRGHPILLAGRLTEDLLAVNEETKGMRQIICKYQEQIAHLEVNDSTILLNFNHPKDYEKREGL